MRLIVAGVFSVWPEVGGRQASIRIGGQLPRSISLALLFYSSPDDLPQIIEVDFIISIGQELMGLEHIVLWRGHRLLLSCTIDVDVARGNCVSQPRLVLFLLDLFELRLQFDPCSFSLSDVLLDLLVKMASLSIIFVSCRLDLEDQGVDLCDFLGLREELLALGFEGYWIRGFLGGDGVCQEVAIDDFFSIFPSQPQDCLCGRLLRASKA